MTSRDTAKVSNITKLVEEAELSPELSQEVRKIKDSVGKMSLLEESVEIKKLAESFCDEHPHIPSLRPQYIIASLLGDYRTRTEVDYLMRIARIDKEYGSLQRLYESGASISAMYKHAAKYIKILAKAFPDTSVSVIINTVVNAFLDRGNKVDYQELRDALTPDVEASPPPKKKQATRKPQAPQDKVLSKRIFTLIDNWEGGEEEEEEELKNLVQQWLQVATKALDELDRDSLVNSYFGSFCQLLSQDRLDSVSFRNIVTGFRREVRSHMVKIEQQDRLEIKRAFSVLGLTPPSRGDRVDLQTVKKRYRELSLKLHPDLNPTGSDKEFKAITEMRTIIEKKTHQHNGIMP